MKNFIIFFIKKPSFINLLTVLIIGMGIFSAYKVKRTAFPTVSFDILIISITYKGASPLEVEKLVTNPIEQAIKPLDGIDELRSESLEGRVGITVQLNPNLKDKREVIDDIKSKVEQALKNNAPEEVDDPIYVEVGTQQQPIISIGIYPKNSNLNLEEEKELRSHIMDMEDEILDISGVAKVSRSKSWRKAEMQINLNPKLMNQFEVTSDLVINALKTRNVNRPGGVLLNDENEKSIRTIGEFNTPEEILKIPIRSNEVGKRILIKDVATVIEGLEEPNYLSRVNGKKAISIIVLKTENGDTITTVNKILNLISFYQSKFSSKYEYVILQDSSKRIKRRLNIIVSNAVIGFCLVVLSLFLFLNFKVALMAALGIPLAIGITFCLMAYFGITSNLISLLGLIIVLGILVDDAIIIGENIYRYIEQGLDPYQAAIQGTLEVMMPVLATICTTIAAFAPLLFMSGIFGKFIYELPLVVIFALTASFFEAILILPSHIYEVTKNPTKQEKLQKKSESHWFLKFRDNVYLPLLNWILKNNKKTILVFILLLIFSGFIAFKFGKFKLFPGDVESLSIKIDSPIGYSLKKTEELVFYIEKEIDKLPKESVENYSSTLGEQKTSDDDAFRKIGRNYAYIRVDLEPIKKDMMSSEDIIATLKKNTQWLLSKEEVFKRTSIQGHLTKINIEIGRAGPPVGKPVLIQITGKDFDKLETLATELKQIISEVKGVYDIQDNFSAGKEEVRITVDNFLASQTGVNVQKVANAINTAYLGNVATKIKKLNEEIDVRVFLPKSYKNSIDSLNKLYITNQNQNRIPIKQLINYEIRKSYSSISHLNGKRLFMLSAEIKEDETTSQTANNQIQKIIKERNILQKYPLGYKIKLGGEFEDTQESLESLAVAFIVGFFIILMILTLLFNKLSQSFIILSVIPFSMVGVIFAFIGHDQYFGFMPFLGVVGLCGVIINDSIVLVDKINNLKTEKPHLTMREILLESGSARLRPVLLTTTTTFLGLVPTAYGLGGKDIFVMLISLGFAWGLLFGSIIILFLVPTFYLSLENSKIFFNNFLNRKTIEKTS